MDKTLSVNQVASRLHVSSMTVLRYVEEGKLRGFQMAQRGWWHILEESVSQFERSLQAQIGGLE